MCVEVCIMSDFYLIHSTLHTLTRTLSLSLADFTYAALQEVGNHWRLQCTSDITNTSAVTWETAEGSEVSRSTGGDVVFTEPVEDSQHERELICHVWVGERKIQFLDVTLLVHG